MKLMTTTTSLFMQNPTFWSNAVVADSAGGYFDDDLLVGGKSSTWYNIFLEGMLDISGQPNTAANYKKALDTR